ncbi:MAG: DUF401 family protein [Desulfovibrio sp.]|jgi:integral membrane protein (TIGR00529 family)|nr:DUF401 family protein [Desulfovibrio sp.]
MELAPAAAASLKLLLIFALIIALLKLHVKLWLTLAAACVFTALLSGLWPERWPGIIAGLLTDRNFLLLCLMIWLMLLLSGVQDAGGQSARLVDGLERYLRNPRFRLALFPALVGLMPMPGGALFSCPMIKAAAGHMNLSDEQKTLINYWFRHIWEAAWPLYPGYLLVSSLLGLSITTLWRYTFPLVFLACGIGWFFFMRSIASENLPENAPVAELGGEADRGASLGAALLNALPLAVTLLGAAFFGILIDIFLPEVPGQAAFSLSLLLAVATALFQCRGRMRKTLASLAFSGNMLNILFMLIAIFLFKDIISASGIVRDLGEMSAGGLMLFVTCMVIPFISGLLTGLMVAFVGLSFPVVLGYVQHAGLQEYLVPLVIVSLVSGNCGQMLSPMHVCLVVTCEFFKTDLSKIWLKLLRPISVLLLAGLSWALVTLASGVTF